MATKEYLGYSNNQGYFGAKDVEEVPYTHFHGKATSKLFNLGNIG